MPGVGSRGELRLRVVEGMVAGFAVVVLVLVVLGLLVFWFVVCCSGLIAQGISLSCRVVSIPLFSTLLVLIHKRTRPA